MRGSSTLRLDPWLRRRQRLHHLHNVLAVGTVGLNDSVCNIGVECPAIRNQFYQACHIPPGMLSALSFIHSCPCPERFAYITARNRVIRHQHERNLTYHVIRASTSLMIAKTSLTSFQRSLMKPNTPCAWTRPSDCAFLTLVTMGETSTDGGMQRVCWARRVARETVVVLVWRLFMSHGRVSRER